MKVSAKRLKSLRLEKNLTLKELSKDTGINISTISNYENGYSVPKPDKLKQLADFYKVSESYILGYSDFKHELDKRLETEIQSLQKQLEIEEKEVITSKKIYDKLKTEFSRGSFGSFENSFLATLLDDSLNDNLSVEELYENKLEELSGDMLQNISLRDVTKIALLTKEEELNNLKSGEIYSPQDRKNPDFEAHDVDQKKISEYLQGIPYHLNYENTMKVVEYAKMLMEKKENRFIP